MHMLAIGMSFTELDTAAAKCSSKILPGGIAFVTIDLPGSKVNTIGKPFIEQVPPLVEQLENDASVKVIVFISGKEGDFIAGADVNMITELAAKGKDAVKQDVMSLQNFFKKMEQGKPKIAAINGNCLGGGLEFALACHYRIATDHAGTSLGVPEVMLGLLPGGGGTQRLPKLIGVQNALPMLLTGGAKKAKQAKSLGLVDMTCPKDQLFACALKSAENLAEGTLKIKRGPSGFIEGAIKDYEFVRNYVFSQAKAQVMKQSGGHYPAPLKILELVKKSIETKALGTAKGYEMEADAFSDLALTPVSDGLKAVFFGQTALKKNPFPNPKPIANIGVLGAGLMGAGIAEVSVAKGYRVALKDVNLQALQRGEQQIANNFKKKVSKKSLSEFDKNVVLSNLVGLTDDMPFWTQHFAKSDLVIEAVFEEIGVKHRVVQSMEKIVAPHCIIASNTSSLAVGEIAKAAKRPENVVGMHYFSPVDKMQLVEIIPHKGTSEAVVATAVQVGLKQGKIPVVCKDVPGFYVNRCLAPYIDESMVLAFEVERLQDLDKAIKGMGFPVGPITLADEVGVDVAFHVHANLRADIPARMNGANVEAMAAIKAAGIKGKRFGSGFLSYPDAKGKGVLSRITSAILPSKVRPNPVALEAMKPFMKPTKVSLEEIQTRMSARFINEAVFCLQDGVIRNQVDGDIAAIFGIGTAPSPP
jgi:enoyl-CoA hydratase / long-chain 3-hydroxyacyl-CoA dehydrogenase